MTPYQKRTLSPIAQRMAGDLRVRNLAQRTIDTYTYHVERFAKHFGRPLDEPRGEFRASGGPRWISIPTTIDATGREYRGPLPLSRSEARGARPRHVPVGTSRIFRAIDRRH